MISEIQHPFSQTFFFSEKESDDGLSLSFESDNDYTSDREGYNTYIAQLLDVLPVTKYITETNINIAIVKPVVPGILNLDYNYSGMSKQLVDALYTEVDWGCVMNHKIFESISNTVHTANLQIL